MVVRQITTTGSSYNILLHTVPTGNYSNSLLITYMIIDELSHAALTVVVFKSN